MAIHDSGERIETTPAEQGPVGIEAIAAQLAAEQAAQPTTLKETIVSEAATNNATNNAQAAASSEGLTLGQLLSNLVDKQEVKTDALAELVHAPARMFQASRMAVASLFS